MPTATTRLVFGRVPMPDGIELRDIVSDGTNTAYDRLGERRDLGVCIHRMVGSLRGTDGYFRGAARNRSLTDFGIGGLWDDTLDGAIYQWAPRGAAIAPWANGPANDLAGDGIAFVQALGLGAVNRDLRSIELSDGGNPNNPFGPGATARQFNALVGLIAYRFDQADVSWQTFPLNPAVGLITYLEHHEFGPKECPFAPVRNAVNEIQASVRAVLKLHQTGVGTSPEPVPAPPPVVVPYSALLDPVFLRQRWGEPRRVYLDGRVAIDERGQAKRFSWNPGWAPCSAWIHRVRAEREFPTPGDWQSLPRQAGGPSSMLPFSNGWVLLRFDDRGWTWA